VPNGSLGVSGMDIFGFCLQIAVTPLASTYRIIGLFLYGLSSPNDSGIMLCGHVQLQTSFSLPLGIEVICLGLRYLLIKRLQCYSDLKLCAILVRSCVVVDSFISPLAEDQQQSDINCTDTAITIRCGLVCGETAMQWITFGSIFSSKGFLHIIHFTTHFP
jgi:hypothetical protein